MPPRGVKKGTKRARQYEHIKQSERRQGASEARAEEIAARTVNKERARSGESETASRLSTQRHAVFTPRRSALGDGPAQGTYSRSALQRGAQARCRGSATGSGQLQRAVDGCKMTVLDDEDRILPVE